MRRHQAVGRREAGHQRQTQEQQRNAFAARQREHDRREQHETHAEEHRQAHDESDERDRPVHVPRAEEADHPVGDDFRAAGFGQHLADDRPEADDDRDEPQRVADALLERAYDRPERHPRNSAHEQRDEGEGDKRVEARPRDEGHQPRDRRRQSTAAGRGWRRSHRQGPFARDDAPARRSRGGHR